MTSLHRGRPTQHLDSKSFVKLDLETEWFKKTKTTTTTKKTLCVCCGIVCFPALSGNGRVCFKLPFQIVSEGKRTCHPESPLLDRLTVFCQDCSTLEEKLGNAMPVSRSHV